LFAHPRQEQTRRQRRKPEDKIKPQEVERIATLPNATEATVVVAISKV
jgi:hypothetical protein